MNKKLVYILFAGIYLAFTSYAGGYEGEDKKETKKQYQIISRKNVSLPSLGFPGNHTGSLEGRLNNENLFPLQDTFVFGQNSRYMFLDGFVGEEIISNIKTEIPFLGNLIDLTSYRKNFGNKSLKFGLGFGHGAGRFSLKIKF